MKRQQVLRTTLVLALAVVPGAARKFYDDDPLVKEPAPRNVEKAVMRKLSDYYDALRHTLATPGTKNRRPHLIMAGDVNTLGEPLQGSWWESRHYGKRMSIEELKRGPGDGNGPDMSGKWTVVSAKSEGITPGFVILDQKKRRYFVKFDPVSNPEMATAADQIASKLFYALGYHVPENYIVHFSPELLELGQDVLVSDRTGKKRKMTSRDLTEILIRVPRDSDGRYRATASLALPGKPLGPYRYYGTRADDPNDVVPHEHRRDLRGMHFACAWIGHDDSRSINTLDVLTGGGSTKYVKHFQLDFGSTLGSASDKSNSPRSGGEYLFAWKDSAVQLATLGLAVPYWAKAKYPNLPSVGRFESKRFDPDRWVPEYPNPAFLNRLPDDDFWMAKQIVSMRDEDVRAIVQTGGYSDPKATEWVTKCLIERRDKIGRAAFARVLPLDRFRVENERLAWDDVAAVDNPGGALPVRVQWNTFDNDKETATPIADGSSEKLPAGDGYLMALLSCEQRPKQTVKVYVRRKDGVTRVVGVERTW